MEGAYESTAFDVADVILLAAVVVDLVVVVAAAVGVEHFPERIWKSNIAFGINSIDITSSIKFTLVK